MIVDFRRTRPRAYAVDVRRERRDDLTMDPAPGYDDRLPHDLVHLVVELEWGLRDGICGQLAAGGNLGSFRLKETVDGRRTRDWARRARRVRRSAPGTSDVMRSEHLASAFTARWNGGDEAWLDTALADAEATRDQLQGAIERAEGYSRQWRDLAVGQVLSIPWPWPER